MVVTTHVGSYNDIDYGYIWLQRHRVWLHRRIEDENPTRLLSAHSRTHMRVHCEERSRMFTQL